MDKNTFPPHKNNCNGLSAADFQRNLYNWFENRGLLDELRAHLRQQMVQALRDTSLRPSTSRRFKSTASPKIQAINLLVAEFLLQQDHHYTLSVFTSEVPLLRSMPEFSVPGNRATTGSNATAENTPRFHQQDVKDILESLGLSLDAEVGNRIYSQYQDNSDGIALLTCILQNTPYVLRGLSMGGNNILPADEPEHPVKDTKSTKSKKDAESHKKEIKSAKKVAELYNAELQEVVYQSQMKSQHIKQLQEEIRRFQDSEVQRVRQEEEEKYNRELIARESRIQADICRREEEINQKLRKAEEKLARKRRNREYELEKKQKHLSDLANQLDEQRQEVACKMQEVENRAAELKKQEMVIEETKLKEAQLLAERSSELDARQQQMQLEFERLSAERETMNYLQHELEDNRLQLVEASHSIAQSQSQSSFLHELKQQCTHLRLELDATRLKLDNITEMQSQKPNHSKKPSYQRPSVERIDKGLQTTFPLAIDDTASDIPERLVPQERDLELELAQSQQQLLQHQQHQQYLTELLRQLQQENHELRGHTQQQRLRIDELTSHASQLANQLQDAQTAITLLSSNTTPEPEQQMLTSVYLPSGSGAISVSPLIPPPPPPLPPPRPPRVGVRPVHSRQMGAGEELSYVPSTPAVQPVTPTLPQTTNGYTRREWRKKPPRRLMVYNNTTSSDETSPTEEILQEARRRLRRLEEESEAVDRSYRDFRQRHTESLAATASVLMQPIIPHLNFQQHTSNFGYGSFTPTSSFYSSAAGTSQTQPQFIFRNDDYNDDVSSFSRHNVTIFSPTYQTTSSFSPLLQADRLPSTIQFSVGNRTPNQYTFPQRLNITRTVDSNATIMSDRIRAQSMFRGTTSSSSHMSPRFVLNAQQSTSFDPYSRTVHQRVDRTDPTEMPERPHRRSSLPHANLLDICEEPHSRNQRQVKNVSFGTPLKTITVYNGPQISSSVKCSANQDSAEKLSDAESGKDLPIKLDQSSASAVQSASLTQKSSSTQSWGEELIINTFDDLPSCVVGSSASGSHDEDWLSLKSKRKSSGLHILNETQDVETKQSSDRILDLRPKSSSSLKSKLVSQEPKSRYKENKNNDLQPQVELQKLFQANEMSASHLSVTDSSNPSGSLLTAGSEGNDAEEQLVFSTTPSSTTIPSDVREISSESQSQEEQPVSNEEQISNRHTYNSRISNVPFEVEDVQSEVSASVTQTTVQNREQETVQPVSLSSSQKDSIVGEDANLRKELKDVETSGIVFSTQEELNESVDYAEKDNQNTEQDVKEQKEESVEEDEQLKYDLQNSQSLSGSDQSDERKFTSSLKAERDDSAESLGAASDQAISVGEDSKKDDSSKDDFW